MADPTDNHGYMIPTAGEQNWGQPLNTNLRALDTDVEIRGDAASTGTYTPVDGGRYTATDTGTVFLGDGAAWRARLALWRVLAAGGSDTDSLLAGHPKNSVDSGVVGAVVGGGGSETGWNDAYANYAVVGGGERNTAGTDDGDPSTGTHATVAGGSGNDASGEGSVVAGGTNNKASGESTAVLGGAGNEASGRQAAVLGGINNTASATRTTIGGGNFNRVSANDSTIAGGWQNTASGFRSTVGGGDENEVTASHGTVGGGVSNTVSGEAATVAGGEANTASGADATVPGGQNNTASGAGSLAAGTDATAGHDGAFVWSDSSGGAVSSTGQDQFIVQASGGVGIGTEAPTETLDVAGAVNIRDVGVSAHLGGMVPVETSTTETVVFDVVRADDRGEYDPFTGVFTCASDGDYRVTTALEWDGRMPGGTDHVVNILLGGSPVARRYNEVAGPSTESAYVTEHLSKTLYGCSAGDEISIEVFHNSGTTESLFSGRANSYLTIDRVG